MLGGVEVIPDAVEWTPAESRGVWGVPGPTAFLKKILSLFLSFFLYFLLHHIVCGISVPRPGIEPATPAVEVRSLNHWTAGNSSKAFRAKLS